MSRFERGKDWNYSAESPKPRKTATTVRVDGKFSLWSSKYQCTFYGSTKEDCERQLMEMNSKRKGQRVLM